MASPQVTRGVARTLLPAVLATALLVAPSSALASSETDDQPAGTGSCRIDNAELQWGLKESFRSYISGSIANGSWETADGATYETPQFIWSEGTGTYDPATGTGSVSFTGTVAFSGHDGVLDMTIANPTFEFEGDGNAALALDTKSNDMEGNLAVEEQQQWVAEVSLEEQPEVADGPVELTDMPSVLTNSGAAAFAGFYEAGVDLDPLALSFDFVGCDAQGGAAAADTPEPPAAEEVAQEPTIIPAPTIPWLPIALGGLALFVIGLTIGVFFGGRKPASQRRKRHGREQTDIHGLMGE